MSLKLWQLKSMLRQWKRSCDQSFKWAQARVWDRCHPPDVCEALRRAVQPGRIGQNMPEPSKSASIDALTALAKPERFQLSMATSGNPWRKSIVMLWKPVWAAAEHMTSISCWLMCFEFKMRRPVLTSQAQQIQKRHDEKTWKDQVFCNFSLFILFLHVIFMSFSFANQIWS